MKKLNELIEEVSKLVPSVTYISLVFKLLEIFIRDFGCDVFEDYFPQVTNKACGDYIRTCWWRKHSQINSETFDYDHINIERDGNDWRFDARLKLGCMLDVSNGHTMYTIYKSQENDSDLNEAFKSEWQELFRNEKNDFIGMIVLRLNQGVYSTLIKSKPQLKDADGFKDIKDFMKTEYAYIPSKEVLTEANEILEKLRA